MLFSFVCLTFIVCGGDRQVGAGQLCSWFRVRFARLNNLTSKEDATYEPINMIRRRTFLGASRPIFFSYCCSFLCRTLSCQRRGQGKSRSPSVHTLCPYFVRTACVFVPINTGPYISDMSRVIFSSQVHSHPRVQGKILGIRVGCVFQIEINRNGKSGNLCALHSCCRAERGGEHNFNRVFSG